MGRHNAFAHSLSGEPPPAQTDYDILYMRLASGLAVQLRRHDACLGMSQSEAGIIASRRGKLRYGTPAPSAAQVVESIHPKLQASSSRPALSTMQPDAASKLLHRSASASVLSKTAPALSTAPGVGRSREV